MKELRDELTTAKLGKLYPKPLLLSGATKRERQPVHNSCQDTVTLVFALAIDICAVGHRLTGLAPVCNSGIFALNAPADRLTATAAG